jgi:hypothetical protein
MLHQPANSLSETPVPVIGYASLGVRRRRNRIGIIATLSLLVGCVGLLINKTVAQNFAESISQASVDAANQDRAAAKEQAAMAAEVAAEKREKANAPRGLTEQEAAAVIKQAESICGQLTVGQRETLTSILRADGQRIVDPSIPVETCYPGPAGRIQFDRARQQFVTAEMMRNPLVAFQVIHRRGEADHPTFSEIHVSPSGDLIYESVDSPAGHEVRGRGRPGEDLSYWGIPYFNEMDRVEAHSRLDSRLMGVIASTMAMILSVLLLVAAVLLLIRKTTHVGVRQHWFYVSSKIPLVLFSLVAFSWAASGRDPGSPFPEGMEEAIAGIFAMIGFIYPIVLIIMLRGMKREA